MSKHILHLFNESKIILDLCGGSGSWSKPYADAGYDVRIITLPDQDVTDFIPPDNVYGILAAPPCTEFSLAKNAHPFAKRNFIKGMIPVNACIRIIWQSNPVFWAIENPVGLLSNFLKLKPKLIFHPWYYGDPWTKKTAIFGNFNIPPQRFTKRTEVMTKDQILACKEARKPQDSGSGEAKKYKRAITPPGFAQAFFASNP